MAEATKEYYPPEFEVEFGDNCNRTITIDTFKHKVRGHWALATLFAREGGGRDVGAAMSSMPEHPGIRLTINPKRGECLFHDPLETDAKLLKRVNSVLKRAMLSHQGVTFVPQVPYKEIDEDTMKTLCLEMLHKQRYGEIHAVTEGRLPTEKELNQMAGERLNDPWSSNPHKPRHAKDYNAWARRMDSMPAV
jgi:hypothetical protein